VVAERHERAALRESTPALAGMAESSPELLPLAKTAGGWQKAGR